MRIFTQKQSLSVFARAVGCEKGLTNADAKHTAPAKGCPLSAFRLRTSAFAFTLIELLVAMSVLALLLTILLGVVSTATSLWRQSENRADAYREARAALTFASRDLSAAWARSTNDFRMGDSAQALLAGEAANDWATNRNALFFLAALPPGAQEPNKNKSDICRVGYFVAFAKTSMSPTQSKSSMNLYRYLSSSDETFSAITNGGNPFATGVLPANASVDLLARNIREFHVRPLARSGTNSTQFLPFVATAENPLPDVVEIEIVAINNEAAAKFPERSDWTAEGEPYEGLRRDEQKFTTRIAIPAE